MSQLPFSSIELLSGSQITDQFKIYKMKQNSPKIKIFDFKTKKEVHNDEAGM